MNLLPLFLCFLYLYGFFVISEWDYNETGSHGTLLNID